MSYDFSISIEPLRLSAFYDVIKSAPTPIGSYDNLSFFNCFSSLYTSKSEQFARCKVKSTPIREKSAFSLTK